MSPLQYSIQGSDLQYIHITLQPNEEFIAEQGAMMFTDPSISMRAIMGDGSQSRLGVIGRFWRAFKRSLTGESFFSSVYKNTGITPQQIAIAAPAPGSIIPINLDEQGGSVICQKGAYLAGGVGQKIELAFQKRIRVGLFGGEGFIMQRISGSGTVFIHASGALKTIRLSSADSLKIDTGCLVGMSHNVRYDIKYTGSLKTSFFGGEGLFFATVSGPGDVWIQSLPLNRLSSVLMSAAITGRGKGSMVGKLYVIGIILFVIASLFIGEKP
ncbi:MAG: AIM24 family protein [Methylotenera sp.]|nr:AIM24 family protein [Methylotenera sp.]